MKRIVIFLSSMFLGIHIASAQYIDETSSVQQSYSVEQLVDTIKNLSMYEIGSMDNAIEYGKAPWSRENLHAAVKQLDLKWTGHFSQKKYKMQIKNPKRKNLKGLNKFMSNEPEYIDSIFIKEFVSGYSTNEYDAETFKTGTFRIIKLDPEDCQLYRVAKFTVADQAGNEYILPHDGTREYLYNFSTMEHLTLAQKKTEEYMKGIKPAKKYTAWDCKSDFGDWYMSIYNNEAIRPKLKDLQFISLMTGETVDGLQVEFKDTKTQIDGKTIIAKNAKFKSVKFSNTMTDGDYKWMNVQWIPSIEIDHLNNLLIGKKVIRPKFISSYGDGKQDKPQIITNIKRFIITDKETYHTTEDFLIAKRTESGKISSRTRFCLAAEMEMGDKIAIGNLSLKEIQTLNLVNVKVLHDWYDYDIYNETVLIPAQKRDAEWAKEAKIRAQKRAEELQKYTAQYGKQMGEAIVNGEVLPGMSLNIITKEMGYMYEIVSSQGGSTVIIVGPNFLGKLLMGYYKCVIVNNKVTMVEDICWEINMMRKHAYD